MSVLEIVMTETHFQINEDMIMVKDIWNEESGACCKFYSGINGSRISVYRFSDIPWVAA